MKKIILLTFLALIIVISTCFCYGEENEFVLSMNINSPIMTINGVEQNIDDFGTTPVIENGRTLVPIRSIIESMGGSVEWEESTRTTTLKYNDDTINLVVGLNTAYFNDIESDLDIAPVIINNRTMLPIRFIAESFKFNVEWDSNTQTILIKKSVVPLKENIVENIEPTDNKILIVYYSATGSTAEVARYIADELNADIFEIEPVNPYTSEDLNWNDPNSRVSTEHNNEDKRNVPLISTSVPNWEKYDTVFVGYPIWWGIAAWPVNGFVSDNDFTGKNIIPFCTSVSSSLGRSGELLENLAGTGNWIEGKRFASGADETTVKNWAKTAIQK